MKRYSLNLIKQALQRLGYRIEKYESLVIPDKLILSENARQTISEISGDLLNGLIMVHGAIQRTGTNYLSNLISLHPDVIAYPNCIWEMPVLACNKEWMLLRNRFFKMYKRNVENMGQDDIVGVSIASIFRLAASGVDKEKSILLKSPNISSAKWFHDIVSNGKLILINRDGRDAVNSTVKTWPKISFKDACERWVNGTKELRSTIKKNKRDKNNTFFIRFEEIVNNPEDVMDKLIPLIGLKKEAYPFEQINTLPVSGSSQLKGKNGLVNWKPIKKNLAFKPVGKWNAWDQGKKKIFKKIAGQTMVEEGYCSDLNW